MTREEKIAELKLKLKEFYQKKKDMEKSFNATVKQYEEILTDIYMLEEMIMFAGLKCSDEEFNNIFKDDAP